MAGTIDKIKAKVDNVLHKDKTHDDPTGPHSSHSANKADPRVDSDRVGTAGNTAGAGGVGTGQYGEGHHGTTGHHTTGTTGGLTGSSTTGGYGTTGHSDPTGPHDSRLANKADPRVDSDRVGPAGNTSGAGGYGTGHGTTGHHTTTGGLTGSSTTGGYGTTGHSDPTGPHDSRLGNKADPRVDSDRIGTSGNTTGFGTGHGTTGHSTTGAYGTTGHGTTGHSDPTGPHDSRLANKLDPRVDSDRVGGAGNTTGAGGYGTGHGTTGHTTTGGGLTGHGTTGYSDPTGPHDSRLGNKADPRVDSDRIGGAGNTTGAGGYGTGHGTTGHHTTGTTGGLTGSSTTGAYNNTPGSGNSNKTAGPHNSDLLNKVDPRVDSDLDGSKTYGGNQTYQ